MDQDVKLLIHKFQVKYSPRPNKETLVIKTLNHMHKTHYIID
jgi:hypothetical protein